MINLDHVYKIKYKVKTIPVTPKSKEKLKSTSRIFSIYFAGKASANVLSLRFSHSPDTILSAERIQCLR